MWMQFNSVANWLRTHKRWVILILLGGVAAGCNKSGPSGKSDGKSSKPAQSQAQPQSPLPSNVVARVHWLGKKRLAAETNAASFMEIWNLPESAKLEAQTLDKLAAAPWHPWTTNTTPVITNYPALISNHPPAALLRPLLDDLVQEESYLEIRKTTNGPNELALAIRLSAERSSLWETNVVSLQGMLAGTPFEKDDLAVKRSGEWTVFGLGPHVDPNAPHLPLLSELRAHLERREALPLPLGEGRGEGSVSSSTIHHPSSNFWFEASLNLRLILPSLFSTWNLPEDLLPTVTSTLTGDGKSVRTHADFDFPSPIPIEMERWSIPTNLIHDPLIGFMAIRGVRPWLKMFKPWNDLQLGAPPNQAFFWAQKGNPTLHFAALPSAQASDQVRKISEFVLREVNPVLASAQPPKGTFVSITNSQGLRWRGVPWLTPTLYYIEDSGTPLVFAGFYSRPLTNQPLPSELLQQLYASTNLAWYDWEITYPCIEGLTQMAQLSRFALGRAQFLGTLSGPWLRSIEPKLGNSVTSVRVLSPTRLSLIRTSSIGLAGVELLVLIDWLESPQFPRGLYTLLRTEPVVPPWPSSRTNSARPAVSTNTTPKTDR